MFFFLVFLGLGLTRRHGHDTKELKPWPEPEPEPEQYSMVRYWTGPCVHVWIVPSSTSMACLDDGWPGLDWTSPGPLAALLLRFPP